MATSTEISVDIPENYAIDQLYGVMKTLAKDGVTPRNITGIVLSLMQNIQRVSNMKGSDKKEAVVYVVKKYIENELEDADLKRDLTVFSDLTLPPLIDEFIALNNRETRIKVKNCLKNLLKKCGC
jgi:hypothetical protein